MLAAGPGHSHLLVCRPAVTARPLRAQTSPPPQPVQGLSSDFPTFLSPLGSVQTCLSSSVILFFKADVFPPPICLAPPCLSVSLFIRLLRGAPAPVVAVPYLLLALTRSFQAFVSLSPRTLLCSRSPVTSMPPNPVVRALTSLTPSVSRVGQRGPYSPLETLNFCLFSRRLHILKLLLLSLGLPSSAP